MPSAHYHFKLISFSLLCPLQKKPISEMPKKKLFISFLFLMSLPFPSHGAKEKCNPSDKKALLGIKADLNNPYALASWDPATDCCEWYVVDCDPTTHRIVSFHLFAVPELTGQIPAAISQLPYLQSITFHKLSITGSIPPSITKLKYLNFLDLSWNKLSGPVPDFLGQLKGLTYLSLAFNQFTGSIPASLSQLKNLGGLRLDRNNLTGSIPDSFGDFGPNLTYVYLSHNQLSGELPRSLGKLNLDYIDLSRNKLEGDASFLFGVNKSVNTIDLSRNSFEFDFSNVGFPSFFNNLDINHNKIFGRLPEGLVALNDSLAGFNVSYNGLCGPIPQGGNLQSYGPTAFFHNKCLCGSPLPPCE